MSIVKRLTGTTITLGGDPEFFFVDGKTKKVIGSEKVLAHREDKPSGIIMDGVQVELNLKPSHCRERLAGDLARTIRNLKTVILDPLGGKVDVSFARSVIVSQKELSSLSPESRVLGCQPSFNIYDESATPGVNGETYRGRSAGGHIHLGGLAGRKKEFYEMLVRILDIVVGNTCVLIDTDPGNAKRRRVYGRAGEYRRPKHGLEYRTLSNFWLQSYPLMSFVMGMSRIATHIAHTTDLEWATNTYTPAVMSSQFYTSDEAREKSLKSLLSAYWDAAGKLFSMVDQEKVRRAINRNDPVLARENFDAITPFIKEHLSEGYSLWAGNLQDFLYFVEVVQEKGLEAWFPGNPTDHWSNIAVNSLPFGWESFLSNTVQDARVEATKKVA